MKLIGTLTTDQRSIFEQPLAAPGYHSFRCKVGAEYVMVGARDREQALDLIFEAETSYNSGNLETFSGTAYTPVYPDQFRILQPRRFRELGLRQHRK